MERLKIIKHILIYFALVMMLIAVTMIIAAGVIAILAMYSLQKNQNWTM